MFDLVYNTMFFASNGNIYGLSNVAIAPFDVLLAYIIAIMGVGYIALTSKEYLYGLLGNNGTFKTNATRIETIIVTI